MPLPARAVTAGVRPPDLPLCVTVLVLCCFSKGLGTGPRKRRPPWRSRPEPYPGSPGTPSCPSGEPWPVLPRILWLTGDGACGAASCWPVAGGMGQVWGSPLPVECPSPLFPTPTPQQWPALGALSAWGEGLFMS